MKNKQSQNRGKGIKSMKSSTQKGRRVYSKCVYVRTKGEGKGVEKLAIRYLRTKRMAHLDMFLEFFGLHKLVNLFMNL